MRITMNTAVHSTNARQHRFAQRTRHFLLRRLPGRSENSSSYFLSSVFPIHVPQCWLVVAYARNTIYATKWQLIVLGCHSSFSSSAFSVHQFLGESRTTIATWSKTCIGQAKWIRAGFPVFNVERHCIPIEFSYGTKDTSNDATLALLRERRA